MKLGIAILLFLLPCALWAQKSIQAAYERTPLSEVIQDLETNHKLVFSYQSESIRGQYVTASFEGLDTPAALTEILAHCSIDFKIVSESYIVLTPRQLSEKPIPPKPIIPKITLCGKVVDDQNTALPYANVYLLASSQGTETDENGVFQWEGRIRTSDTVSISYVGYRTVKLTAEELLSCPSIQLVLQKSSFAEIVVKEYVLSGIEQAEDLSHFELRPKALKVVPGLTEADVLQMVQILPGIKSDDESATGLHIRGGTPDQNLVLWDGIPVYNSGHFFGMISAFNPYIVNKVKVYRGSFGSQYGGRISGVVDINSLEHIPNRVQGYAGINFTHADIAVLVPLAQKKSALLLSSRRAYTDIIESPTFKKLSQRVFSGASQDSTITTDNHLKFSFYDLNAKWLYQPNAKNKIAVSGFYIGDKLLYDYKEVEYNIQENNTLHSNNLGLSGKWQYQWKPHIHTTALLSYTDMKKKTYFQQQVEGFNDYHVRNENMVSDWTFHLKNEWKSKYPIQFGYQFANINTIQNFRVNDGAVSIEKDVDASPIHSAYLSIHPNISKHTQLDIGFRWNYFGARKKMFVEPRVSLFYLPTKQFQLKFSWGVYQQFISQLVEFNTLGINDPAWALASKKEGFPVTENHSLSLGAMYHTSSFQFEIETYFKNIKGLSAFTVPYENDLEKPFDVGKGYVQGADVLIKKRWGAFQTWMTYSWNKIRYLYNRFNGGKYFIAPTERPHSFSSVQMYNLKKWQFSLSWKFTSGKPYSIPTGISDSLTTPIFPTEEINKHRLPVYHRLDASIMYKITPQNKKHHGLFGISILNLYNRKNILKREFIVVEDMDNEEGKIIAHDRSLLRFTPNLVFRWSWE